MLLLVSDVLVREVRRAPRHVSALLESLPRESIELLEISPESEALRDAHLRAGVLTPNSAEEAHHVALATVARADLIVSWNFKHIVHFEKMRGFNAVNLREGYSTIEIHSPKEVV
ncbi:MAG: hypothetical protein FLDDKLPJ_01488 [Phycisphaerae bacterium]|nr:hypothetical protein [Phycisphaerae bacterium]